MQAVANFGTVQLRRLSTKSALDIPGAPMATAWIWYWQHDGNVWQMFTDEHEVSYNDVLEVQLLVTNVTLKLKKHILPIKEKMYK